jgi:two-component system sensor histidine kinase BaeS
VRLASLRARLFAAIALVALLSLALALAIGAILTRRAVERNTLRDVSAQFDLLVEREREAVLPFSRLRSLQEFVGRQDQRIVPVRLDGSAELLPPERAAQVRRGLRLDGTVEADGTRYLYAARLVKGKGFMLLRPTSSTSSSWRPHVQGLIVAALATALLAALIAFLLARAIARPVRRVAEATRGLASSTGEPPLVPVEGPRELALLAESFNEVAVQLAKAREAERAFLLSVSHELKTPLTAIRGYAEGLQDGAVPAGEAAATIVAESRRLERLVGDVLDLARMRKAEFSVRRERVDLNAIAGEALRRYDGPARDFGVTLEADGADDSWATGDADRTLQIVSNLVENALRLTPSGGSVRIVSRPGELRVEDTGPGLGPEDLARAFERFYLYSRYGHERPVGTGLGLAIVKELAEGMGGSVAATSSPGELTVFVVRLPVAAAGARVEIPPVRA